MAIIRTINSEVEIRRDLYRAFKFNRTFEQKAFYLGDGASIYYINLEKKYDLKKTSDWQKRYNFFKENFLKNNEKIAFVSLGCGNANREMEMLEQAHKEGYEIDYYGVDSSMAMLELAEEYTKNCNFSRSFICGDFSGENFRRELNKLLKSYSKRLFGLFGNTLGNVPQNYMADTLRNMLNEGDILWLEVNVLKDQSDETAASMFERYMTFVTEEHSKNFFRYPLKDFGIDPEKGELTVEMKKISPLKSLLFTFGFNVKEKIELDLDDEIVTLLPGSVVTMHDIMAYSVDDLIEFFKNRGFGFVQKSWDGGYLAQIAFVKEKEVGKKI